jgi:hypothetical protein
MTAEHEMAVEPERAADQEDQLEEQSEENEEGIMLRASDLLHF